MRKSAGDQRIPDERLLDRFMDLSQEVVEHRLFQTNFKVVRHVSIDRETGMSKTDPPDWTRSEWQSFALLVRPFLFNETDSTYMRNVWAVIGKLYAQDYPELRGWLVGLRRAWEEWRTKPGAHMVHGPLPDSQPDTFLGPPTNRQQFGNYYSGMVSLPEGSRVIADIDMLDVILFGRTFHHNEKQLQVWEDWPEDTRLDFERAAVERMKVGSAFIGATREQILEIMRVEQES